MAEEIIVTHGCTHLSGTVRVLSLIHISFEVMRVNPAIRNLIREEKTHQIDSVIAANRSAGMRTMDQSLFDLVKEGTIAKDIALKYSICLLYTSRCV